MARCGWHPVESPPLLLTANTTVTAVYTLQSSAITFTDDPLTPGSTPIKAVHIVELRNAINSLRTSNFIDEFVFTDPTLSAGELVEEVHVTELRAALAGVYAQRSRPLPTYTDPTIIATATSIRSVHVAELRMAVRLIE